MAENRDLRCTCPARTLLARVARDPETGAMCLHIKAFKRGQRRPVEVMLLTGTAKTRCRDCGRWFRLSVVRERVAFRALELPNDCGGALAPSTVAANRYGNDSGTTSDT